MKMINSKKASMTTQEIIYMILGLAVLVLGIIYLTGGFSQADGPTKILCGNQLIGNGTCEKTCGPEQTIHVQLSTCRDEDSEKPWCCITPKD